MDVEIDKENWTQFFKDLSKRRFAWETRIQVIEETTGEQLLSNGLYLNGVSFEEKSGASEIEISVGRSKETHQMHKISTPKKVTFSSEDAYHDSKIEIEEENGTRTILRIFNPMPIMVGDAAYHLVPTHKKES